MDERVLGTVQHSLGSQQEPAAESVVERPRLVYFYGRTSGLSRRVDAYLSQILQKNRNHNTFKLIRVPVEDHADLAALFQIVELPTIVVVDGRRVRARVDAPRGRPPIEKALAPWLR